MTSPSRRVAVYMDSLKVMATMESIIRLVTASDEEFEKFVTEIRAMRESMYGQQIQKMVKTNKIRHHGSST